MAIAVECICKSGDISNNEVEVSLRSAHIVQNMGPNFFDDQMGRGLRYLSRLSGKAFAVHCGLLIEIQWLDECDGVREEESIRDQSLLLRKKRSAVVEFIITYNSAWFDLRDIVPKETPHFSIPMVKSWILDTEDTEVESSSRYSILLEDFRLIDVVEGRIVQVGLKARYVALSYVWGTSEEDRKRFQLLRCNIRDAERLHGLFDQNLPPLISDAINLCRELGERYLWVDRLCIIQDDAQSKHSQISAMDTIYQQASFTIVALADIRQFKGLPGASNRPRSRSFLSYHVVEDALDGQLNVDTSTLITESRWSSRGWTFQEQILSNRLLYISENHVFLVLHDRLFAHEPLNPALYKTKRRRGRLVGGVYFDRPTDRKTERFKAYRTSVEHYKKRNLTYNSDALNAFLGVGQHLATRMRTSLLFGLPEKHFLRAQFWKQVGPWKLQDSTLGLPSWSWAGWEGSVEYQCVPSFSLESAATIGHLVKFHFVDPIRGIRPVEEDEMWFSEIKIGELDDADKVFRYEGNIRHLRLAQDGDRGDSEIAIWRESGHSPWDALSYRNISLEQRAKVVRHIDCLVFNSTTAMFKVRATNSTDVGGPQPAASFEKLEILDEDANVVGGTMEVDLLWAEQNLDLASRQKFIVLGGGRRDPTEGHNYGDSPVKDTVFDENSWALFIMLALMDGDTCQRVTIGWITPKAWGLANPQWELIIIR
ncbi:heterokaryon incompatibility protein-domain-containing protein [Xylaria curta]|nr:heterokaryon incompatibility protein-domain-containing protein [Xylaria curta]